MDELILGFSVGSSYLRKLLSIPFSKILAAEDNRRIVALIEGLRGPCYGLVTTAQIPST